MASTLTEHFEQAVRANPAATAIVHGELLLTFRQLQGFVNHAAQKFHDAGVRPGEPIAVSMASGPVHLMVLLALFRLGALVVHLGHPASKAARGELPARYGLKWAVLDPEATPLPGVASIVVSELQATGLEEDSDVGFRPIASTPARVAVTSGTTGVPKGVLETHGDFLGRIATSLVDADADSRFLAPASLHVTVSLAHAVGFLLRGATVVFPVAHDFASMAAAIRRSAVTHLVMSPAALTAMAPVLPLGGPVFPHVKHLRFVGATPTPEVIALALERFTPHTCVAYGTTEGGLYALATPAILAAHPGCTGKLREQCRLEILGEDGEVLLPGEIGEVRVRGPVIHEAYYRDEEASRRQFRDGWFHPGDFGRLTADGLLWIEGRTDNVLNAGGHKVRPERFEAVLQQHPGVQEAIVFALADQSLAAAILVRPGEATTGLPAFALEQLGPLAPKRFFVMSAFPRNSLGKVMRQELAALAAGSLDQL